MLNKQMKSISLSGNDITAKRNELRIYFHQSFDLFESLFELLSSDEVFYRQSEPTRHPMIFYFGHTAVFYINKLISAGVVEKRINQRFESLFAVGVDEMSWDEESSRFQWPDVNEVREYRDQVRRCVDELIMRLPMTLPITQEDPFWAIWMGIEHERIHIETSSVLHRQMPIHLVSPHANFPLCPVRGDAPTNQMVSFKGGRQIMGKGGSDQGLYGWDNEYGIESLDIEPFEASLYLVSNGEYMEFVRDGGYQNEQWWDEEGLKYLHIRKAEHPPFWIQQEDGSYRYRALANEIDMPMNWPVEVNALEAAAFCRWKSTKEIEPYRLPSEAEWYSMIDACGIEGPIFNDENSNLNLAHYGSSVPVDTYKHRLIYDGVGNVWQWTSSAIDGYHGFSPHPWYDDFSTPTFDNKHNVMKGGSWISTGNEIVLTSRYAFRRHFIQHAGFRYVRGKTVKNYSDAKIITEKDLVELCRFDFEEGREIIQKAIGVLAQREEPFDSLLEIGCGAGGMALAASNLFNSVTGLDASARIIAIGTELIQSGKIEYGEDPQKLLLSSLNVPNASDRVKFYQADSYNLKPFLSGYTMIILNNLHHSIDFEKVEWKELLSRLNPGGQLGVIGSNHEIELLGWGNAQQIALDTNISIVFRSLDEF